MSIEYVEGDIIIQKGGGIILILSKGFPIWLSFKKEHGVVQLNEGESEILKNEMRIMCEQAIDFKLDENIIFFEDNFTD